MSLVMGLLSLWCGIPKYGGSPFRLRIRFFMKLFFFSLKVRFKCITPINFKEKTNTEKNINFSTDSIAEEEKPSSSKVHLTTEL